MFDGWTPREVHEHFDADGNLTGRTVVTREAEWDESSRERAIELDDVERGTCPCGCGQPLEETRRGDLAWKVDHFTCGARRAVEKVRAKDQEEAKQANRPDGWDAGRIYHVVEPIPVKEATRGN